MVTWMPGAPTSVPAWAARPTTEIRTVAVTTAARALSSSPPRDLLRFPGSQLQVPLQKHRHIAPISYSAGCRSRGRQARSARRRQRAEHDVAETQTARSGAGRVTCWTCPGSVTTKRAPPPGRSSTRAVPPCNSANRCTSDRPMPTPPRAPAPWRKGSKISSLTSSGTRGPRPRRRRPPFVPFGDEHLYGRPRGVCRAALLSRFSTIRSTFARIDVDEHRLALDPDRVSRGDGSSRARRSASSPTSVGSRSGWSWPRRSRSRSRRSSTSRDAFLPACSITP